MTDFGFDRRAEIACLTNPDKFSWHILIFERKREEAFAKYLRERNARFWKEHDRQLDVIGITSDKKNLILKTKGINSFSFSNPSPDGTAVLLADVHRFGGL